MPKLDDYRKEIEYCTYCPKMCRFSCPVAQVDRRETVTPTAKMTLLHLLKMGAVEWSREVVEPLYLCTGCLISRTFCDHGIEVFPPFVAAREEIVRRGVAPEKVFKQDVVVEKHHNPYGKNLGADLKGYVPGKYIRRDAEVTFFVGCITTVFYESHIHDAIALLEATGVDFGVYADDYLCCGYPSYSLGHISRFREISSRVAKNLSECRTIVTVCPTCAHTLRDLYKRFGISLSGQVLHMAQFLHPYYKSGKINFVKKAGRILYHDPCHLGRYANVYDEPRDLIKATCEELIEFPWNREESGCCGGGGGLLAVSTNTALEIARQRMSFADEVKPDLTASACPTCDKMMERVWDKKKVTDMVCLLKESLAK